ncbi:glycosyltransferase family 4 protein [Marinirhabdus gelatinilytica]|uniref:Colanic acid/amylovoran biosynthesis glycosyltransferase n=1 Tax=Marinirhabdus gelatinilytica TaxID=1703343 RepID=A0A370Q8Y3_9FLAO|nr:glycosyltransferase family 4 protein [Marinirhabdus gelatinilytica]RDK84821.1 colanic acid/amylovoran biosynthesis glycosyltransferase [Marinirhabdus gelatinilytica]
MRIGIVLSQPPGYSETFFTSKIKGLQEHGITVHLFVQKQPTAFTLCKVVTAPSVLAVAPLQLLKMLWVFIGLLPHLGSVKKFVQLERSHGTPWGRLFKKIYLNSHILKAKLDWLHFGFATQALGSELVAKAIGAKMAVSFRGFDLNVYPVKHPGCYDVLWKQLDKVHSISTYLYEKAIDLGLAVTIPHQIITPAVAMDLLPSISETNNKTLQIATIARLNWIKGLDTAIAALARLKKQGFKFQYHLIGAGSIMDTERYTYHAYEENLTDEVVFHGKLNHSKTLELLERTDVYVQPSINEGFCNAVLEAQALGKLVIASNVGGLPENVIDGKTGWLFPVENTAALANTIQRVVQLSAEEKEKVSTQATQRVAKHFTIAQQQQQFVSFYTEAQ